MAALELLQPEISVKDARKPHEMTTLQFGKENTDVWIEYITFEMKNGNATRISNIYERAVHTLKKNLADNFISEFSLIKANSGSLEM